MRLQGPEQLELYPRGAASRRTAHAGRTATTSRHTPTSHNARPTRTQRSAGGAGAGAAGAGAAGARGVVDARLPHVARPRHDEEHPVHVTMRRVAHGPSFRAQRVCAAIRVVIAGAKRNGVRVLQYSVQDNHLHLMVEGSDSADLSNQMRTLFSRIAFAVNAVARRHGKLFRDRHHRHELKSPREVRNALVYILFNDRKHGAQRGTSHAAAMPTLDPCSSAWWFDDWAPWDTPPKRNPSEGPVAPTSKPRTWLASFGWRWGLGRERDGRIRFRESPRHAPR